MQLLGSDNGLGAGIAAQIDLDEEDLVSGIVSLKPHQSKRLIARAVVKLPVMQRALKKGIIIVSLGTTNAYIAEELLGQPVPKYNYAAGFVSDALDSTDEPERVLPYVFKDGEAIDVPTEEIYRQGPTRGALLEYGANDVFIKGANAVDAQGNAAVMTGNDLGGTCGGHMGVLWARGANLIVPVGLEKMVPSVLLAVRKGGVSRLKYSTGLKVGIWPIVNATVITELQAFPILYGVKATHVASGGIGGGEGSVVLVLEGEDEKVAKAVEAVEQLKATEPQIRVARGEMLGTLEQRKVAGS